MTSTVLFGRSPAVIDVKKGSMPRAMMQTPIICSMVTARKSQSSVSNAEAIHVKLIHAQIAAKAQNPKPRKAVK
ncbi:Uncharacterised protein (plasmid) [Tsukamurella tyrosinosolvens]|nr:Uncharacterised protein [Tsukamurella tyrosinosolvens]